MIRTAATLVAAVALVVAAAALVVSARSAYRIAEAEEESARSAYRIAEAEEEQACWARISASAVWPLAMAATSGALLTLDAQVYSNEQRQQMWEERTTAFEKMFDVCEAL